MFILEYEGPFDSQYGLVATDQAIAFADELPDKYEISSQQWDKSKVKMTEHK